MFPIFRPFKRAIPIFLAVFMALTLTGCENIPPEAAQQLKIFPELISRAADVLDDLAARLDDWLDSMSAQAVPVPEDSSFAVHFIDVGQADCALVSCDGAYMLIDGGNAGDSDLVFSYLKAHDIAHLDYMVATHAHEDHIGGLSGAAYAASVGTAFSPVTEGDTKVFKNLVKSLEKQNVSLTVPSAGDTFSLGSAQVEILGPIKEYEETASRYEFLTTQRDDLPDGILVAFGLQKCNDRLRNGLLAGALKLIGGTDLIQRPVHGIEILMDVSTDLSDGVPGLCQINRRGCSLCALDTLRVIVGDLSGDLRQFQRLL